MLPDSTIKLIPSRLRNLVPAALRDRVLGTQAGFPHCPSTPEIAALMRRYQTTNLVGVTSEVFRARILAFLALNDAAMEGFSDPATQRDLSIRFHWGHDHDFGDFKVSGRLGTRHISLIAALVDWLGYLPKSLAGLRVLDLGCWTGGTSLVLAAMGAEVTAVEEVRKYIDALQYLRDSFAVENLRPVCLSLYDCTGQEFEGRFDIVLFAGVLYHVTDPVLALRIVFNCLKDGGRCIVETAAVRAADATLAYQGPTVTYDGDAGARSRSGWNWFLPSQSALTGMMSAVGFTNVRTSKIIGSSRGWRLLAAADRERHRDMLRGGLSLRTIR
jgi:2-polyprenyl-3-methyl-5-hydroxy-6-metoxy-1,4-benzoquinol methylase